MSKSTIIWIFAILGWVVSYVFLTKWLMNNQWDFFGGWIEAFTSSDFATGFLIDLSAITIMMIVLALSDRHRLGTRGSILVIASLGLSVSMSLGIYLVLTWQKTDSKTIQTEADNSTS